MGCAMWIRKKIVPLILSLLLSISSCVAPVLSMPVYADFMVQGAVGLTMIVAASMAAMGVGINAAHNTSQALVDGLSDLIGDVKNNWASDFPDEMDKTSKTITSGSKQETAVWGVNQNGKFYVPEGLEKSIAKALVDKGYTLSAEEQDAKIFSSGWKPGNYKIEILTDTLGTSEWNGESLKYGIRVVFNGNIIAYRYGDSLYIREIVKSSVTKSGYEISYGLPNLHEGEGITTYRVYYVGDTPVANIKESMAWKDSYYLRDKFENNGEYYAINKYSTIDCPYYENTIKLY